MYFSRVGIRSRDTNLGLVVRVAAKPGTSGIPLENLFKYGFRRNDEVLSLLDGEGMKLRYGRVDFKISPRLVESWLAIHPRIRLRCLAEEQVVGDRFNFLARVLLSTRGEKRRKKEEKLVCLLQLGNEMFARETIVGGTMVGGVTARGWKYVVRANGPLDRPLIG